VFSTIVHKHDDFHEDWIWLDAEKDAGFSSYASVDSELAKRGISSIDGLCDDLEGYGSSGEMRPT
jgi:hypothetical protein